jgi:uncharacterized membrane protein
MSLAAAGRLSLGVAFLGFGVLHLLYLDFVTRVFPWWPDVIPARPVLATVAGAGLMVGGAALVVRYREQRVAGLLAVVLFASLLVLAVPVAVRDAAWAGSWTVAGKVLAMGGGLLLVAGRGTAVGPWCFGAFLALCGIQHFIHVDFVTSLVPAWIPGARFWTWFTGVALVAGGVGVALPGTARLAGLLTGGMIFTWLLILHVPRALTAPSDGNPNETVAVLEALAMSGIGWLVADRAAAAVSSRQVRRAEAA